jgi:MFS transporter, DHA2 family, multidrug resistance protein
VKERAQANPIDRMGLGLVAVGVGCLEFVLDKGQEKDWFGDRNITFTFMLAIVTLAFFVWWEWRHPDPIVDLKLLKNRNFGTAVGFQFILGSVLFSTTVLIPQFLQSLMGYTAERSGMALSAGALVLMVMMPVAGRLVSRMDARLMVSMGFLATSLGLYNMTRLDLNVSFGHIVLWRVFQVLGLSFIFIPISTLNYVGVPKGKNNQISSFSNFARNFGGSMGTALLTTFLVRTQQTHQSSLGANLIPGSFAYENFLAQTRGALMAAGESATQAKAAATGYAYQQLLRQSSMLSYQNAFWLLSIVAALLVPWPFIMRRPPKHKKPPSGAMEH